MAEANSTKVTIDGVEVIPVKSFGEEAHRTTPFYFCLAIIQMAYCGDATLSASFVSTVDINSDSEFSVQAADGAFIQSPSLLPFSGVNSANFDVTASQFEFWLTRSQPVNLFALHQTMASQALHRLNIQLQMEISSIRRQLLSQ